MGEPNFIAAAKRRQTNDYGPADGRGLPIELEKAWAKHNDAITLSDALTDPTPADAEWLESLGATQNGDVWSMQVGNTMQLEYGKNTKTLWLSSEGCGVAICVATNPTKGQVAAAMLMFSMGGER